MDYLGGFNLCVGRLIENIRALQVLADNGEGKLNISTNEKGDIRIAIVKDDYIVNDCDYTLVR